MFSNVMPGTNSCCLLEQLSRPLEALNRGIAGPHTLSFIVPLVNGRKYNQNPEKNTVRSSNSLCLRARTLHLLC